MKYFKFNALGSEIIISADLDEGQEKVFTEAEKIIVNFEKRFSRFISDNELYALNFSAGNENAASPMLLDLLGKAKELYSETDGIFDPTIIESLEAVGYDKSFKELADDHGRKDAAAMERISQKNSNRIRFDKFRIKGNKISAPFDFRIDLGGIGKGYIIDLIADNLFSGIKNFWISAGGDLIAKGSGEGSSGWKIGVQDPLAQDLDRLSIYTSGEKAAVATSGIIKRRGKKNGIEWHHLIDPRTGLPADNDILSVTAISSSAARADVFAKTVLILGEEKGLEFIEGKNDSACIVFAKGREPVFSSRMLKYIKTDYEII